MPSAANAYIHIIQYRPTNTSILPDILNSIWREIYFNFANFNSFSNAVDSNRHSTRAERQEYCCVLCGSLPNIFRQMVYTHMHPLHPERNVFFEAKKKNGWKHIFPARQAAATSTTTTKMIEKEINKAKWYTQSVTGAQGLKIEYHTYYGGLSLWIFYRTVVRHWSSL